MSTSALSSHVGSHLRPLAAILCVDIEDHDGLLATDGEATHERIENHRRESILPTIAEHDGRLINDVGKGVCAIFDSPLAAVRCAVAIRQGLVRRNALFPKQPGMQCRIGISLGQLFGPRDDVSGNGLNVAARLQSLSEPGTIYVSAGIYQRVRDKLGYEFRLLGVEKLNDTADPAPIYSVLFKPVSVAPPRSGWIAYGMAACVGLAVGGTVGWYGLDGGNSTPAEKQDAGVMALQSASERPAAMPMEPAPPPDAGGSTAAATAPAPPPAAPPRLLETIAAAPVAPPEPPVEARDVDARQTVAAAVAPVPTRALRPYEPFRE